MIYDLVSNDPSTYPINVHRCIRHRYKGTRQISYATANCAFAGPTSLDGVERVVYLISVKDEYNWRDYECTKVATCASIAGARALMNLLLQEAGMGATEATEPESAIESRVQKVCETCSKFFTGGGAYCCEECDPILRCRFVREKL